MVSYSKVYFLLLSILVVCSSCSARAVDVDVAKQSEENVARFPGVRDLKISPSGRYVLFHFAESFVVVESGNIPNNSETLQAKQSTKGSAFGFLPSDAVLYVNDNALHKLNPLTGERLSVYSGQEIKQLNLDGSQRDAAILSENILLTGDGSYDWGGEMGNIYSFDLKVGKVAKRAKIPGMFYPQISPNGRWMIFEYGAEDNNNSYIYDVEKDKNYSFNSYFNFKNEFPDFKEFSEYPVKWLNGTGKFLARVSEDEGERESSYSGFLVLFDATTKQVVWKTRNSHWFFPTLFQQIDEDTGIFSNEHGVFTVKLKTGEISEPILKGESASVSPDKKRIAFFESDKVLMIADFGDKEPRPILSLPGRYDTGRAYKGMGIYPPLWLPDSSSLFVLTETEAILIRL